VAIKIINSGFVKGEEGGGKEIFGSFRKRRDKKGLSSTKGQGASKKGISLMGREV